MTAAERIAALRQRCLQRKTQTWWNDPVVEAASTRASAGQSWQLRRARLTYDRLLAAPLAIDDCELLIGRLDWTKRAAADNPEVIAAREYLRALPGAGGQRGHCELDRTRVFNLGLPGLLVDLRQRAAAATEPIAAETLTSFVIVTEGLLALVTRAATTAEEEIPKATAGRQAELRMIADTCRALTEGPPRTFRQALQLLWLVDFSVQFAQGVGLTGPGHLDRTLRAFYEADLAAGRVTREQALELIECLYLLVNELIPDGLAIPVMCGGRDVQGNDLTNDLSYLSLEALRRTALVYPTVGVCWHQGTPADLTALAVELIAAGYSTPAFFGDEVVQRGLKALGCPPEDACNYINSTCVEITPVGASGVWVASPYFNTCALLLEEIAAQATTAAPAATFADFVTAYRQRLARAIAAAVDEQNELRRQRQQSGRQPLQSIFTKDCIERGRDIDDGGPRYNWVECSFVGLANLADSLHVIREEVFSRRNLTCAEMKEVLDGNFAGQEPLRQRFLKSYPKYGNDDPSVDDLVRDTVDFVIDACRGYRMLPDDSSFVPGAFVWIMHERLGSQTGATPDGRCAGFPFADGCGPAQGREQHGPTAAILSTTSWNQSPMIGGCAFNMKFNRTLFSGPRSVMRLQELILTFLQRGGFETQVNVVDHEVLQRARENPEAYRDLVVRIGGYTDYFIRLSPGMQEEVMQRTAYAEL